MQELALGIVMKRDSKFDMVYEIGAIIIVEVFLNVDK